MQALWISVLLLSAPAAPGAMPLDDVELRDAEGKVQRLDSGDGHPLLVIAFLGNECPLSRLYSARLAELHREFAPRGVAFVGVNSNRHDSAADTARFARELQLPFPLLKDPANLLADRLVAKRIAEVFVLDRRREVRYRGRVDDQYTPGVQRPAPTRRDLASALEELLAGKPVGLPATEAAGCLIDRLKRPPARGEVTYCKHVAPVLQRHCQVCHRTGQIAPFPLTTYDETLAWAETMREVVRQGRMPPWHAEAPPGHFANDPRLTEPEKQLLEAWVAAGCPEGDPAELPPPATFPDGWTIGKPDQVIPIPEPFTVPAAGVIEYQMIEVDPGFRQDRWIQAAEVRPGNRGVVHHCSVFLKPPGAKGLVARGELGSCYVAGWTPGTPPWVFPEGMAKLVPAGWRFLFVLHYTPNGSVQTDRTSLGLTFADPKAVRKEVATNLQLDENLCIPPHAADHRVAHEARMEHDVLLLAMFPHMHLRGKSFRYEAAYPDGTTEVLLNVPRWDFNWQNRYVLAEPKRLPAGTLLRCSAVYDNSTGNPINPDPNMAVRTGPQSWDEMFNGYYELALADQDLTQPPSPGERLRWAVGVVVRPLPAALIVVAGFLLLRRHVRRKVLASGPLAG
jgi:peroxiredoxin